jgi:hypothetical protein
MEPPVGIHASSLRPTDVSAASGEHICGARIALDLAERKRQPCGYAEAGRQPKKRRS